IAGIPVRGGRWWDGPWRAGCGRGPGWGRESVGNGGRQCGGCSTAWELDCWALGLLFFHMFLPLYTGPGSLHKTPMTLVLNPGLERRLKAEGAGEVLFDRFTRGRYATDASSYQMVPLGVVVPRTQAEAERAMAVARAEGVTVVARGG